MLRKLSFALAATALAASTAVAQPQNVSIELSLLVDVSGSIDNGEFNLQKSGYVNVFNNAGFWNAFAQSGRTLAVEYREFSGAAEQAATNWYFVNDLTSAQAFASAINAFPRQYFGLTAPGSGINSSVNAIQSNGYNGTRRIIDISADGCANDGAVTSGARDNAELLGITINTITIGTENSNCGGLGLNAWYALNAQTTDGFTLAASDFTTFGAAIEQKIGFEVIGVPEPGTFALLGVGLFGLVAVRRFRGTTA